jgi:hypothetical protein
MPRKKKAKEDPRLVQLIRQGAERVRLPEWPEGQHVRLTFPGPQTDLYDGDRRMHSFWLGADEWANPNWEIAN